MTEKPKPNHFIVYGAGLSMSLMENIAAKTTAIEVSTSQGPYKGIKGNSPFVEFWPNSSGFLSEEILANRKSMEGSIVTIVQSVGNPVTENLTYAKIAAHDAKRFGAKIVHLVCPYIDLREDKEFADRGTSFTNPMYAQELATAGVDYMTIFAPHSKPGVDQYKKVFRDNLRTVSMSEIFIPVIKQFFEGRLHLLRNGSPDGWDKQTDQAFQGAMEIARAVHGDQIDIRQYMWGVEKKRDKANKSRIVGFHGDVAGMTCLSTDDMFDGGKTSIDGGVQLDEHGAKEIFLAAVHPIFSETLGPFLKEKSSRDGRLLIDKILTTNTLPVERAIEDVRRAFPKVRDRIHVVDVSNFVLREIQHVVDNFPQVLREARHIPRPNVSAALGML